MFNYKYVQKSVKPAEVRVIFFIFGLCRIWKVAYVTYQYVLRVGTMFFSALDNKNLTHRKMKATFFTVWVIMASLCMMTSRKLAKLKGRFNGRHTAVFSA